MEKFDVSIRRAKTEDCAKIFAMVCELAEFEKLGHEVVSKEADFQKALFADETSARALVAEHAKGELVGFALYFSTFSTFLGKPGIYLEDLYVKPEARGSGVGLALLQRLAQIGAETGCGRLEWSVLDWNEKAIDFYRSLGARHVAGWDRYRMDQETIENLASS